MIKAPAANTRLSPAFSALAVVSVPYHNILPPAAAAVSHTCSPEIVAAERIGPNVIAPVLDALPAGDAAAAISSVWRVMPEPVAISDPDTDDGTPSDRPTLQVVGRVTAALFREKSNIAFSRYAAMPAMTLSSQSGLGRDKDFLV